MTELTDNELIEGILNGDQGYFEELIGRYSSKAYNLAFRLTRNKEDAEEVLQDVFTTIHKKLDSFEGKSSFSSWMYRITVNAGLMKLRKRRQDKSSPVENLLPQIEFIQRENGNFVPHGGDVTLRKQLSAILEKAIKDLPEEYKSVFILRDVDGLTSKEVAKIMELSIPAVKSRLHRARLMLRKKLAPFYREFTTGEARLAAEAGSEF